jgi:hypothetical protein
VLKAVAENSVGILGFGMSVFYHILLPEIRGFVLKKSGRQAIS